MAASRFRANCEALRTAIGAAFAFVPFVPRLLRAAATGPSDRRAMAATICEGLDEPVAAAPQDPPVAGARPLRVLLVAGEPSGDLHAGNLAAALIRARPGTAIDGIGGPKMAAAGVRVTHDLVSDPVMGVWPVVRRTPAFFRLYRDLLLRLDADPPDVIVGVDYPGLNLRIAKAARRRGIPFVLYVAPQVWAWAPWRARSLARDVSTILAILPFETGVFRAAGANGRGGASGAAVAYVGHPLFEHLDARPADREFGASLRNGLGEGASLVALMPGSRRSEVRGNLPVLLDAARIVVRERPGTRFVLPLASERLRPAVEEQLAAVPGFVVTIAPPARSDDAMAACDAALTVSGTATLHLVAHGVPAAVIYRASAAGRALSRLLLVSPWIALPNLLSGDEVFPEALVGSGDGPRAAAMLLSVMPGGARRERAVAATAEIRRRLGAPGVAARAAAWTLAAAKV